MKLPRARRPSSPPLVKTYNADPAEWLYVIEPIEPCILGRYRIYLVVTNFMRYAGNDGWGWGTWTLAGAERKGARELARYRRRQAHLARRRALILAPRSPQRGI